MRYELYLQPNRPLRDAVIGLFVVLFSAILLILLFRGLPEELSPIIWLPLLIVGAPALMFGFLLLLRPLWHPPPLHLIYDPPSVELFASDGRHLASFNLEEPHRLLMIVREPSFRTRVQSYNTVPPLWVEVYLSQGRSCVSWDIAWKFGTRLGRGAASKETFSELSSSALKDRFRWAQAPKDIKQRLQSLSATIVERPRGKSFLRGSRPNWPPNRRSYLGLSATQYRVEKPSAGLSALMPMLESLDSYREHNELLETVERIRSGGNWDLLKDAFPAQCFH
ncbi:MAG: hypothetical protein DRO00_08150 [Thermoproteota archaeon]|nr:MAG: hypothetical protein DRO00_08150 [Candidatus Korarchaeota archaeon]